MEQNRKAAYSVIKRFESAISGIKAPLSIYYLTLLAFLYFSLFPEGRTWGLSVWSHFPLSYQITLAAVSFALPLVFLSDKVSGLWLRRSAEDFRGSSLIPIIALTSVFAVGFYLLRGKVHFLGDGYTLLSELASDIPLIKNREIGESIVHIWIKNVLQSSPREAALFSYQLVSIASGVTFVSLLAYFSSRLTIRRNNSVLLFLGLMTGGYTLLFFGYVENYSLFLLSMLIFCLTGLFVARGLITWLWLLPVFTAGCLLHVLGLTMLPAALYLGAVRSPICKQIQKITAAKTWMISGIGACLAVGLLFLFYHKSLFFQLSLIPLVSHTFTLEGYTLFSYKHILDVVNLYFLLLPSLPILTLVILSLPKVCESQITEHRFLALATLGAVGATLIFDPKLGMPRDWDLFAFGAVPLSLLLYLRLINSEISRNKLIIIGAMSISLGLISLVPRVVAQTLPEIAIAQFRNYVTLDKLKNRNAGLLEAKYYESVGNFQKARKTLEKWNSDHPELKLIAQANTLRREGELSKAIGLLETCVKSNPFYSDAWANLGLCFLDLRLLDTALYCVEAADALNPYNAQINNYFGMVLVEKLEFERAERRFQLSIEIDTSQVGAYLNLAHLYARRGDYESYLRLIIRGTSKPHAPAWAIKELGDYYLSIGDIAKSSTAYETAVSKGADSAILNSTNDQR